MAYPAHDRGDRLRADRPHVEECVVRVVYRRADDAATLAKYDCEGPPA